MANAKLWVCDTYQFNLDTGSGEMYIYTHTDIYIYIYIVFVKVIQNISFLTNAFQNRVFQPRSDNGRRKATTEHGADFKIFAS